MISIGLLLSVKTYPELYPTPRIDGFGWVEALIYLSKWWAGWRLSAPFIFYKVYIYGSDSASIVEGLIHNTNMW